MHCSRRQIVRLAQDFMVPAAFFDRAARIQRPVRREAECHLGVAFPIEAQRIERNSQLDKSVRQP